MHWIEDEHRRWARGDALLRHCGYRCSMIGFGKPIARETSYCTYHENRIRHEHPEEKSPTKLKFRGGFVQFFGASTVQITSRNVPECPVRLRVNDEQHGFRARA
jgi:hypothetical protein